jgi:hypothetical protein
MNSQFPRKIALIVLYSITVSHTVRLWFGDPASIRAAVYKRSTAFIVVLKLLYKPLPFRFFLLTLTNNLLSKPTHPNKTYLKVLHSTKMQLLLIPLLAALVPFAVAQSADIASWSVAGCSSGSQGTTTVHSNSGECYAEDSGQSIMLQSISGGCTSKISTSPS